MNEDGIVNMSLAGNIQPDVPKHVALEKLADVLHCMVG